MSYTPSTSPLIFVYSTANQSLPPDTELHITGSLYAGQLASSASNNDTFQIDGDVSLVGDVKYSNTSAGGYRATTYIKNNGTPSISRGYNIDGDASANKGVCDELCYSVSNAGSYQVYADVKPTVTSTYEALYTRLTGLRIST